MLNCRTFRQTSSSWSISYRLLGESVGNSRQIKLLYCWLVSRGGDLVVSSLSVWNQGECEHSGSSVDWRLCVWARSSWFYINCPYRPPKVIHLRYWISIWSIWPCNLRQSVRRKSQFVKRIVDFTQRDPFVLLTTYITRGHSLPITGCKCFFNQKTAWWREGERWAK